MQQVMEHVDSAAARVAIAEANHDCKHCHGTGTLGARLVHGPPGERTRKQILLCPCTRKTRGNPRRGPEFMLEEATVKRVLASASKLCPWCNGSGARISRVLVKGQWRKDVLFCRCITKEHIDKVIAEVKREALGGQEEVGAT